jgi:hypothetical protein
MSCEHKNIRVLRTLRAESSTYRRSICGDCSEEFFTLQSPITRTEYLAAERSEGQKRRQSKGAKPRSERIVGVRQSKTKLQKGQLFQIQKLERDKPLLAIVAIGDKEYETGYVAGEWKIGKRTAPKLLDVATQVLCIQVGSFTAC